MSYQYKVPEGEKYIVSHRKWNKLFNKRGRSPFTHVELYVTEDVIIAHHVKTKIGLVFMLLISPIVFLTDGFNKQTLVDIKKELFDKKYGRFSSDGVYRDRHKSSWDKMQQLIGNKDSYES